MKSIYIIGGGSSLVGFDFTKLIDKTTIAVNKSYAYIPNLDFFVTIDFTALRKIKYEFIQSNATKIFIANFSVPSLKEIGGRIVDTRWNLVYNLQDFDMIIKSRQADGIGLTLKDFRTGNNSGYCAFQLAVALGYTNIHLLGIDLNFNEQTHFHGGYGEDSEKFYEKLNIYFNYWVEGIEILRLKRPDINIYSRSKSSKLNSFIPYKEI